MGTALRRESWTTLLGADPREWLLECDEPAARWVTLTELLDRPADDPARIAARGRCGAWRRILPRPDKEWPGRAYPMR